MTTFTEERARCLLFTYKEGLLARMAHDLELRVDRFHVTVDPEAARVDATFDPASIRVTTAMRSGAPAPEVLTARDRDQIEKNLRDEVLRVARHPEIRFRGQTLRLHGSGWWTRGALDLCGVSREISITARRQGDGLVADASIHQPDWGIAPFSALMGAIRIQPRVDVRLSFPAF